MAAQRAASIKGGGLLVEETSPFGTPRDNEGLLHRRGKAIPAPLWARQLRRFLETASLFPPPAALRRFPLDPTNCQ